MKEARKLALYKVKVNDWNEAEFAAASNQMEAIDNVSAAYENIDPQTCSVSYINKVYLPQTDAERIAELEEENAKLKYELEKERAYNDNLRPSDDDKQWLPTVEQIKSVYAAAGVMSQVDEKTDSDHLMALWADLKKYLENYNEKHGIGTGK